MAVAAFAPAGAKCTGCTWAAENHEPSALPARLGLTCGEYSPAQAARPAGIDWDALERQAQHESGRNAAGDQVYRTTKGFKTSVSDYVADPDGEGHLLWTGDFVTVTRENGTETFPHPTRGGTHELCGKGHRFVARAFKEEALGYPLPQDVFVVNSCGRHECVAPTHFRLQYTKD